MAPGQNGVTAKTPLLNKEPGTRQYFLQNELSTKNNPQ